MEPFNKKENLFKSKNYEKKEKNYFTFDNVIFQPQLMLQLLESSLTNQKNFIIFIKNNFDGFPKLKSIKNIKQIFYILPNLIKQLDLPFSSLLLEENELMQLFIEIYVYYNEFSKQISSIFEIIYILFDIIEEYLIENPMDEWKDILFDLDIMNENEKYISKNGLTNVQTMFINLNNLLDNWVLYRNMGNNIEEENIQSLDEYLKIYSEELIILQNDDYVSIAILEYFDELILKIKDFRNEKFIEEYQYIKNEISLEDQFNNLNINEIGIPITNKNENKIKRQNIKEILSNLHKIPLNKRTFFYKNEKIIEDESLSIEYKDYYFPFGDKQILELKRQICGFLNSEGGRLYIGISDQKIIKGIVLNYNSLNSFQNLLFNCINNFTPKIPNDKIKIYYIPIKTIENDQYIENLYVVKLIIYPGEPTILYSISPKNLYSSIRLQGQCANLTAEEIHKKIIERHKKGNKTININEIDFEDPPPEFNLDNDNNIIEDEEDEISQNNKKGNFTLVGRKRNKKKKNYKTKNKLGIIISIKMYNIDENLLAKDLKNYFKDSGCFSLQFFQKRNGKSRGFGFLYFSDEKIANYFIEKSSNMKIGNKIIKLKKEYLKLN